MYYLELLQEIIRVSELELIYETSQSFVVQINEGHVIMSIGVDELLLKQLRILHEELTNLWIDDKGFTIPDPNAPIVNVAIEWLDLNGFQNDLVARLLRNCE